MFAKPYLVFGYTSFFRNIACESQSATNFSITMHIAQQSRDISVDVLPDSEIVKEAFSTFSLYFPCFLQGQGKVLVGAF